METRVLILPPALNPSNRSVLETGQPPESESTTFSVEGALDQLEIIGGGLSAADRRAMSLWEDSGNAGVSARGQQSARGTRGVRRGQRRYGVPVPPAVRRAIENASRETGVPQDLLMVYAFIESSFDPNARNGSYVGLFQMSQEEFVANGGRGRRTDPVQNALAAARDIRDKMQARSFPRNESANEQALYLYVQHQQGEAGARAHYANLD
ncbi:MAG: transglycosylase SLT domain-containing protein, partial [Myxococcota bacterium]